MRPLKMFQNSNKVELFWKVNGDIFNQIKLLVNNVDFRINFNIETRKEVNFGKPKLLPLQL